MIRRIGKPGLLAAASLVAAASLAFAHDPARNPGDKTAMMNGCGEHHSEAMKARDQVKVHLAESDRPLDSTPALRALRRSCALSRICRRRCSIRSAACT